MSDFDLIAFDMDGTLLNPAKEVSPGVAAAIERAAKAGKTVALCTGRCPSELWHLADSIPQVRYAITESGALIYDLPARTVVKKHTLPAAIAPAFARVMRQNHAMVQGMEDGLAIAGAPDISHMATWHMDQYQDLYEKTAHAVPDMYEELTHGHHAWEKLNIFHTDTQSRMRSYRTLEAMHLDVVISFTETTAFEATVRGVDKGSGLRELCQILGVDPARTIGVGDSGNDIRLFGAAGLSVAMGNSTPEILDASDVVVADNAHDGAAEAIDRYLLA